uniref:Uncharacterized protein n=1 Tax=Onchocerca volvulus TaxID=6282 RepID=A0A8R1TZ13_ONCVO
MTADATDGIKWINLKFFDYVNFIIIACPKLWLEVYKTNSENDLKRKTCECRSCRYFYLHDFNRNNELASFANLLDCFLLRSLKWINWKSSEERLPKSITVENLWVKL